MDAAGLSGNLKMPSLKRLKNAIKTSSFVFDEVRTPAALEMEGVETALRS